MNTLPTAVPFNAEQAMNAQYLYHSYYTVWLVAPNGTRYYLAQTARKTGSNLLSILYDACNKRTEEVATTMQADLNNLEWTKKTATNVFLNNGWKVGFGGTIRQEAFDAQA